MEVKIKQQMNQLEDESISERTKRGEKQENKKENKIGMGYNI